VSCMIDLTGKRKPPYNLVKTHAFTRMTLFRRYTVDCSARTIGCLTHHCVEHTHSTRPSTHSGCCSPTFTTSTAANACSRARSPAHRAHRLLSKNPMSEEGGFNYQRSMALYSTAWHTCEPTVRARSGQNRTEQIFKPRSAPCPFE